MQGSLHALTVALRRRVSRAAWPPSVHVRIAWPPIYTSRQLVLSGVVARSEGDLWAGQTQVKRNVTGLCTWTVVHVTVAPPCPCPCPLCMLQVDMATPGHMTACLTTFQQVLGCTLDNWDAAFSEVRCGGDAFSVTVGPVH